MQPWQDALIIIDSVEIITETKIRVEIAQPQDRFLAGSFTLTSSEGTTLS